MSVKIGAEDGLAGCVNLLEEGFFILGSRGTGFFRRSPHHDDNYD